MEDKDNNENRDEETGYDLYTEHIIPENGKKFRQFFQNVLLVIGMAVLFGAVAGLVMLLIYKTGISLLPENDKDTEIAAEAETDTGEVTMAPVSTMAETEAQKTETEQDDISADNGIYALSQSYDLLKKVCDSVKPATVTVTMSESGTDWTDSSYQNVKEEFGIIIAKDESGYYILMSYSPAAASSNITVRYNDGNLRPAKLSAGDPATGMAVIRAEADNNIQANTVQLGDSNTVMQGDILVAVGKLRNYVNGTAYGMAAGVGNKTADTDIEYSIINTDIVIGNEAFGMLCNTDGSVVGVITPNYSNGTDLADAFAISDITGLIENLINHKQRVYLGVKGQSVSDSMQKNMNIPSGVYVVAVEGNSPAYGAGIQTGDVITTIAGREIKDMKEYMESMEEHSQGEDVEVVVKRKGRDSYKDIVFRVVLGVQ